ncbi:putative phage abortive infection protein [Maribellus sediminis]|uniref:putative phage abortive infection protein n=1 Tax=Maribellus sediminis TaxID=2696285 RepID=UPI00142F7983|nr:putative phage abortive infection protein [Maribellus sediminis]
MTILLIISVLATALLFSMWKWEFGEKVLPLFKVVTIISWLLFFALLFIGLPGSHECWKINTTVWSEFGSFAGAFLLAATLIYQVRSFRRQQIEAKFFEMVKYYRENVSEMKFRNPFYYSSIEQDKEEREFDEKYVEGRRVIKTIFEQYKVGQKIAMEVINEVPHIILPSQIHSSIEKQYRHQSGKGYDSFFDSQEWKRRYAINEIAYMLTFWGIPHDTDDELRRYLGKVLNSDGIEKFLEYAKEIVAVYEYDQDKAEYSGNLRKEIPKKCYRTNGEDLVPKHMKPSSHSGRIKFFGGHQYHLGHYYRHLFQAVRFIDKQPWWLLTKDDKYEYVKTLRAQMSNYEQALLFINSLTKLGRKWEYENNKGRKLISDYNLVNNLPERFIPMMRPQFYYPEVEYEWKTH